MLYEDRLYGFVVAAIGIVQRVDAGTAPAVMDLAEAMEAEFTARLKARRDAAEQAAKRAREDADRTERPRLGWGPACVRCDHVATLHNVDDEERRQCMAPGCGCRQYECVAVQP